MQERRPLVIEELLYRGHPLTHRDLRVYPVRAVSLPRRSLLGAAAEGITGGPAWPSLQCYISTTGTPWWWLRAIGAPSRAMTGPWEVIS